jgi:hypothetical protein
MNLHSHTQAMSPFAQVNGTGHQRTQQQALMAMAVAVSLLLITRIDRTERHSPIAASNAEFIPPEQQFEVPLKLWSRAFHSQGTLVISRVSTMPRARGKPRRGAAWYTAESRRQRQKKFEQALAMASIRRRKKPRTPPMAYVEEITLEDAMQSYPKLPLFTVPDNWNPPTDFGSDDKPPPAGNPLGPRANSPEEHFTTCYVEEETPSRTQGNRDSPPGAPMEAATQLSNRPTHASEGATGPIPPASVDSHWQDQQLFTDSGYLALIFDLRSLLDDQVFRLARIDQRLDMLFAAHSRTLPKWQCPTCAQAYALPAGWRKHGDEDERTG